MTKPFHLALEEAMAATGISLRAACDDAQVSYEQFKKFLQRSRKGIDASTNVDDCIKLSHAFGLTLDEMVGDDTAMLRSEAASLWRQLTKGEREILLAAERGRRAPVASAQKQSATDSPPNSQDDPDFPSSPPLPV